jgi:hypothetical protein
MHIRSKWTMRGHFKHPHSKTFLMVSWGFNLVFVYLFNQGFKHSGLLHECNSQSGSAFKSHWAPSLALSPICEIFFRTQTHSLDFMALCTPHLVANPMLRLWHQFCFATSIWLFHSLLSNQTTKGGGCGSCFHVCTQCLLTCTYIISFHNKQFYY